MLIVLLQTRSGWHSNLQYRVRGWEVRKVTKQDVEASPTLKISITRHCCLRILQSSMSSFGTCQSLFSCRHVMSMCTSHARTEEVIVIGTWDFHMFYKKSLLILLFPAPCSVWYLSTKCWLCCYAYYQVGTLDSEVMIDVSSCSLALLLEIVWCAVH